MVRFLWFCWVFWSTEIYITYKLGDYFTIQLDLKYFDCSKVINDAFHYWAVYARAKGLKPYLHVFIEGKYELLIAEQNPLT